MGFETTAVGMALAKVAELAKVLRDEKRTQQELKIINQFESANIDAKQKAFDLYVESSQLKAQKTQVESEHVEMMARLARSHAEELAALKKTKAGIKCDCCGEATAQFICVRPSSIADFGALGLKERHYKCSNCGGEYDKQIEP